MQQYPLKESDLMEVRRKPLGDITNSPKSGQARMQMMEAEKKMAESLATAAIGQKEILRLQTVKTVGLLKEQLAKTETVLSLANQKIAILEEQRIYDKQALSDNVHMSEHILEMENEILAATQEHETIVVSMNSEREQFARRLSELEKKVSDTDASAGEAGEATSRNVLRSESNEMCATLQATVEQFKLSEINLTNRISLLKAKLSAQIRLAADSQKEMTGLAEELVTTKHLLAEQTEVNVITAALAAEKESILQSTLSELQKSNEAVQSYGMQLNALQLKLEDKTYEATSTTQRMSSLTLLLESEKCRVICLEKQFGDLDEAAQREMEECQDSQAVKDDVTSKDLDSLHLVIADLNEQVSVAEGRLAEGKEQVMMLQEELISAEYSAESSRMMFQDKESQLKERLGASSEEVSSLQASLTESEDRVAELTVALETYEGLCKQLSIDLATMGQEKERIMAVAMQEKVHLILEHSTQLSEMTKVISNADAKQKCLNEKNLNLESCEMNREQEIKRLQTALSSCEAEILSLEISKNNTENYTESRSQALQNQIEEKALQIELLHNTLNSANSYQQAQGKELSEVVEEMQAEKDKLASVIKAQSDLLLGKEDVTAALIDELTASKAKVTGAETSIRLIIQEVTELSGTLQNNNEEVEVRTKNENEMVSCSANASLVEMCTTLKKKVSDMKLEVQNISNQMAEEKQSWQDEALSSRKREEIQAETADNLLKTMNRLKEEVWGAFKIKLAEKESEIQGLTAQIDSTQKQRAEAEDKSLETVKSLTAAHEKYNELQEKLIKSNEEHGAVCVARDEEKAALATVATMLQQSLLEKLRVAESESIANAAVLKALQEQKAITDQQLKDTLSDLARLAIDKADSIIECRTLSEQVKNLADALLKAREDLLLLTNTSSEKVDGLSEALNSSAEDAAQYAHKIVLLEASLVEAIECKNLLTDQLQSKSNELSESHQILNACNLQLCESFNNREKCSLAENEKIMCLEKQVSRAEEIILIVQGELEVEKEYLSAERETSASLRLHIQTIEQASEKEIKNCEEIIEKLTSEFHAEKCRVLEIDINTKSNEESSKSGKAALELEVQNLTCALQISQSTISTHCSAILIFEKDITSLQASLLKSEDKSLNLSNNIEKSESELASLSVVYTESVSHAKELQLEFDKKIEELNLELKECQDKYVASIESKERMTCELLEAAAGLEEASVTMATLTAAMAESKSREEYHQSSALALQSSGDSSYSALAASLAASESTVLSLTTALQELQANSFNHTEECAASAVRIAELLAMNSTAQSTHKDQVEEHVALIAFLQNELDIERAKATGAAAPTVTPPAKVSNLDRRRSSRSGVKLSPSHKLSLRSIHSPVGSLVYNCKEKDKEFSHMQGEIRRFRYARDEAKVSMSKMAGRVAILKDRLNTKAALDLASHAERERHRADERERARKSAEQVADVIPDASVGTERDDLLSQVKYVATAHAYSPESGGKRGIKGKKERLRESKEEGQGGEGGRGGEGEDPIVFFSPPAGFITISRRMREREKERNSASDDRNAILACDPSGGRIEDFYKDTTHDPVTCVSPKGSFKSLRASGNFATDIDIELRNKLKAIKMEEENGEEVSGKEMERSSQQLTTRLDKLHKELDVKNKIVSSYEAIKLEMDRKKEENKELKGRVFSLETATVLLQQELSVMRALHKPEKAASPVKSAHRKRSVSFQDMDRTSTERICMSITDGCQEENIQDAISSKALEGIVTAVAEVEVEEGIVKNKLLSSFDAEGSMESGSRSLEEENNKENNGNDCNKRDSRRDLGSEFCA